MKLMQRDPNASDKARRAERKADEKSGLITIKPLKLGSSAGKGGFKKGGFRSAFGPPAEAVVATQDTPAKAGFKKVGEVGEPRKETTSDVTQENSNGNDNDDEPNYEYYDPRRPTGCNGKCGMMNT